MIQTILVGSIAAVRAAMLLRAPEREAVAAPEPEELVPDPEV